MNHPVYIIEINPTTTMRLRVGSHDPETGTRSGADHSYECSYWLEFFTKEFQPIGALVRMIRESTVTTAVVHNKHIFR